jgi:uncharacterized protein YcfL
MPLSKLTKLSPKMIITRTVSNKSHPHPKINPLQQVILQTKKQMTNLSSDRKSISFVKSLMASLEARLRRKMH